MKHICVVICFFVIFCAAAFPQASGTIQCDVDMKQVPAWTGPGTAYMVENLSCGQMVSITGIERGYIRIQLGDRIAYVDAKYVRIRENQDQRITQLEEQVKKMQQESAIAAPATSSRSQNPPPQSSAYESATRFDVAGMFSWVREFGSGYHLDYFGWNAAFNGNITEHFGLEANVSGNYYNSPVSGVGSSYYALLGGPRISFPRERVTPFVHFLVGLAHGSADAFGLISYSDNAFALMPGFGLDVNINRRFAIRVIQADYPLLYSEGEWSYKNMRIGGGFVTRF